jgi:hypothetical protein
MQDNREMVQWLQESIPAQVPAGQSMEELLAWLSAYCNDRLQHDFPGLIQLLYRVDVSEQKLKYHLGSATGEDAGTIMAHLLLERVEQIIESRRKYRMPETDMPEDEKW